MMSKSAKQKQPWTNGEKALFGTIIGGVIFALIGYFGWRHTSDEPVVSIPTPTMPAQNAYDYFQSAGAAAQDDIKVSWAYIPWSSRKQYAKKNDPTDRYYSLPEKRALIQENAAALKTLRQGFAFPCRCPAVRSFRTSFPGNMHLRQLARLLALDSQVKQERGDWNGVMQSDLDAVEMGEDFPRGGVLVTMLTGNTCQSMGRRTIWGDVDHLNAPQAEAAARRLEAIRGRHVPFGDVAQEEEWWGEAGLMEMFRDGSWRGDWRNMIPNSNNSYGFGSNWTRQQQAQMLLISKKTVMQDYQTYMDQAVRNAHQPYAANVPAPTMPSDPLTQECTGVDYHRAQFRDAQSETQNALLTVAFALRAYKLQHGSYPAALTALVPGNLTHVPDDPFALSGPLQYKQQGSKYILYSIGPDGKDDGGKPIFDSSKPPPPAGSDRDYRNRVEQNSSGDVVAGVNF